MSWLGSTKVQDLTTTIIKVTNETDLYATLILPKLPDWATKAVNMSAGLPASSYLYLIADAAQKRAERKANKSKPSKSTSTKPTTGGTTTRRSRTCNHCTRPGHFWQDCKSLQMLNENTRKEVTSLLQQGYTYNKYPEGLRQRIAQERSTYLEKTKSAGASPITTSLPNHSAPKNGQ